MPVEQRERAIRVVINQVNWQQEEPTGYGGGRQLSLNGTSRISREAYVRSCERLGVQFPGLLGGGGAILPPIPIFGVRFSPACRRRLARLYPEDTNLFVTWSLHGVRAEQAEFWRIRAYVEN